MFAFLFGRLFLGDLAALVQDLAGQPDHLLVRRDRQRVVAQVTPSAAVADLAQLSAHRLMVGVIQFRRVVRQQDHPRTLPHLLQRSIQVRPDHRRVRHRLGFDQAVQTHQIRPIRQLVRQAARRTFENQFRGFDQSIAPPIVTELRAAKMKLTQLRPVMNQSLHAIAPAPSKKIAPKHRPF